MLKFRVGDKVITKDSASIIGYIVKTQPEINTITLQSTNTPSFTYTTCTYNIERIN